MSGLYIETKLLEANFYTIAQIERFAESNLKHCFASVHSFNAGVCQCILISQLFVEAIMKE
jgi:hypothetical protein